MDETSKALKPWVTFAGCVLVVVVLYWAQAVFVPIALAILLTFVLAPPVTWLERWVGRVPAVLAMGTLVFTVLGLAGWVWRGRWTTWPRAFRVTGSTSWRRSRTCVAPARGGGRETAGNDRRHQD